MANPIRQSRSIGYHHPKNQLSTQHSSDYGTKGYYLLGSIAIRIFRLQKLFNLTRHA
jgi:hypothetical protein